jgi:glycosyltransferase involved in cell wall biosynthesis
MKKYIDFSMGLVSNAIVLGNGLRFIFKKWLSDDHIYVVPNGTDLSPDLGSKFESVGYHRPLHLLYLSTLIRSKGVFDAIDVVKKFKKTYGEILLHVAGERNVKDPYDGQDRTPALFENLRDPEVLDSIKDLGVITGKVKEKELVDADILLLPTCYPYEGLPNVILEAMAAGCVVISTYHAAIPEVVLDGETGFLVEKNQPEQLLKCVKRLHEDRALLKKMMIASRNRYQALYTAKKSNDLLIETLAKCVN